MAMPSVGCLHGVGLHHRAARLVGKQVNGVGGVMPQQVVGPAAGLAQSVDVAAPKEEGLHIHVLHVELACHHFVVYPLVAGVKAARVPAPDYQASLRLQCHYGLGIRQAVCHRNFCLHMLARFHACNGLRGVHLRRRAQNHRINVGQGQALEARVPRAA